MQTMKLWIAKHLAKNSYYKYYQIWQWQSWGWKLFGCIKTSWQLLYSNWEIFISEFENRHETIKTFKSEFSLGYNIAFRKEMKRWISENLKEFVKESGYSYQTLHSLPRHLSMLNLCWSVEFEIWLQVIWRDCFKATDFDPDWINRSNLSDINRMSQS